jgi:hypothetical protein
MFKAIVGLKKPYTQPSSGVEYMNVAGEFDADDNNLWANTPYGLFFIERKDVHWVLFTAEEYAIDPEQLPAASVLN